MKPVLLEACCLSVGTRRCLTVCASTWANWLEAAGPGQETLLFTVYPRLRIPGEGNRKGKAGGSSTHCRPCSCSWWDPNSAFNGFLIVVRQEWGLRVSRRRLQEILGLGGGKRTGKGRMTLVLSVQAGFAVGTAGSQGDAGQSERKTPAAWREAEKTAREGVWGSSIQAMGAPVMPHDRGTWCCWSSQPATKGSTHSLCFDAPTHLPFVRLRKPAEGEHC